MYIILNNEENQFMKAGTSLETALNLTRAKAGGANLDKIDVLISETNTPHALYRVYKASSLMQIFETQIMNAILNSAAVQNYVRRAGVDIPESYDFSKAFRMSGEDYLKQLNSYSYLFLDDDEQAMFDAQYLISAYNAWKEKQMVELGKVPCGKTVMIGGMPFIVLSHRPNTETTAVVSAESFSMTDFGPDANWETSYVRAICNDKIYKQLCAAVTSNNIVEHHVNLVADNGIGKEKSCLDKVSVMTAGLYRKYREYLDFTKLPSFWTATRLAYDGPHSNKVIVAMDAPATAVNYVRAHVCPYCILKSSVLVRRVEEK